MKVDILAFGVHPDDVELGCSGTLIASAVAGKKVAVVDLTGGELGTRGSIETRKIEAADAAGIMRLSTEKIFLWLMAFFKTMKQIFVK
jgi:LmbE family N-acetylglucosaminyl deacetylase